MTSARLRSDACGVLVTGANGLVGAALLNALHARGEWTARGAVRRVPIGPVRDHATAPRIAVGDIGPTTDWSEALDGVRVVIHTAARVHQMADAAADPLAAFCRVNVDGTLNLARQAAAAGVQRIVYLSSIKVNGERTEPHTRFRADDPPNPQDPYAVSKHLAETGLRALAAQSGLQVVVIRPPLVYGSGVRANFATLLHAVARGLPLPLGAIDNARSLIALPNLVDFIMVCMHHPAAANETFVVCDGEDLSTPELVRRLAAALHRPARLLPVPPGLLRAGAALLGRHAAVDRLCGHLQIDHRKACDLLGWRPPIDVDEGLRRTVQDMVRR